MMKRSLYFLACLLFLRLVLPSAFAQNDKQGGGTALMDTAAINQALKAATLFHQKHPDSAIAVAQKVSLQAEKQGFEEQLAGAWVLYAKAFFARSAYDSSAFYYDKAMPIAERIGGKPYADCLIGFALTQKSQGDTKKALEYYFMGQKIYEKIGDTDAVGVTLNNIGTLYLQQRIHAKAREYFKKSILTFEMKSKMSPSVVSPYNNLGRLDLKEGNYSLAVAYFQKADSLASSFVSRGNNGLYACNIAEALMELGQFTEALKEVGRSMEFAKKSKNIRVESRAGIITGAIHLKMGETAVSIKELETGMALAVANKLNDEQILALGHLMPAYEKAGDFKNAYKSFKDHKTLDDSLRNEENYKASLQKDFEQKEERAKIEKEKADIARKAESDRQKIVLYAVMGALALMVGVAFFAVRSYRIKQKSNKDLQTKNEEIQAKNSELAQQKEEITVQAENLKQLNEEISAQTEELTMSNAKLQDSYQDIQTLSEIGQGITSSLDLDSVVDKVYKSVNDLMDASVFGIGIYNPAAQEIEYRLAVEKGQRYKPYTRDMKNPDQFPVWCIQNRQEVFINDVFEEYKNYISAYADERAELADGSLSEAVTSMIYLPLMLEEQVLGIMTVQSFKAEAYSRQDLTMLKTLGSYIAIAIENSKSYEVIADKNRHITDSIRYAETIQKAILPTTEKMTALFGEHFVFFRPKDIVSGDFYWASSLEKDGVPYSFMAVVDCTGHGVPGAFMSMIAFSILNETVNERKTHEPNEVLEQLDAGIRLALRQDEKANEDGMDLSFARINPNENGVLLSFAGAKRPAWISQNGEIEEIKGSKRSIGGLSLKKRPFEQEEMSVQKGAMLYLFSDGFPDQSDAANQKYGSLRLKEFLQGIASAPCIGQLTIIAGEFDKHKGGSKQKDDISLVGMRL